MAVHVYKTNPSYDPTVELSVYESQDEHYSSFLYEGFRNLQEANAYAISWQETYEFGYFGSAFAEMTGQGPIVRARRRNSCD